ncbi:MAG: double-strand break repair protein AddB, partial [Hyphomicrobiaceae bacterium]
MPHSGKARNIFTIPPSVGFLDALAQAVLAGTLPGGVRERSDPFELTKSTILLPTRRAARGLQEAFLQTSRRLGGRSALLLPAMRPIAEGEEDATLLAGVASRTTLGTETDIPPAVSELERRLVLMQFVQQWSRLLRDAGPADGDDLQPFAAAGARTPAQAAHLAQELARLIDMVETEGVNLDQLAALVPETFSEHWQQTLNFLDIVVSQWPGYLLAAQRLSP